MIDILEEFWLLSTALQSSSTNIQKAQKFIKCTIKTLENLKIGTGKHESQIEGLIKSDLKIFHLIEIINLMPFLGTCY